MGLVHERLDSNVFCDETGYPVLLNGRIQQQYTSAVCRIEHKQAANTSNSSNSPFGPILPFGLRCFFLTGRLSHQRPAGSNLRRRHHAKLPNKGGNKAFLFSRRRFARCQEYRLVPQPDPCGGTFFRFLNAFRETS